jgi:ubiquitin-activating enzyme E1 C
MQVDNRWENLRKLFTRTSYFGNETGRLPNAVFTPGNELFQKIRHDTKVLVVGAGGLGCEILKDLALSGISDIHVIGKLFICQIFIFPNHFLFRRPGYH